MREELNKLRRWSGIVAKVASLQLLVQMVNAVTGFLIVRSLIKSEYAWFTIINTVSAVLVTAGDSGLSSGLLSCGGKVWQDNQAFSRLVVTALKSDIMPTVPCFRESFSLSMPCIHNDFGA